MLFFRVLLVKLLLIFSLVEHRIYQWIAYSLFLIIPAIGIIFLSFKLVKIVNQRKPMPGTNLRTQEIEKRRRKKDKEARLQLYSIVVMFILGYAPITSKLSKEYLI